jgi:transcriptional regulator with XRE-family HTH domain
VEIADRFAENVVRHRRAAGLTQEQLAERAALHRTQIGLLESGKRLPRLETLIRLAGSLGVSTAELTEGIVWEPIVRTSGGIKVAGPE